MKRSRSQLAGLMAGAGRPMQPVKSARGAPVLSSGFQRLPSTRSPAVSLEGACEGRGRSAHRLGMRPSVPPSVPGRRSVLCAPMRVDSGLYRSMISRGFDGSMVDGTYGGLKGTIGRYSRARKLWARLCEDV